jgi:hypothetical protein
MWKVYFPYCTHDHWVFLLCVKGQVDVLPMAVDVFIEDIRRKMCYLLRRVCMSTHWPHSICGLVKPVGVLVSRRQGMMKRCADRPFATVLAGLDERWRQVKITGDLARRTGARQLTGRTGFATRGRAPHRSDQVA